MNSVRDLCAQPDAKKLLMLCLATYCNGDGICFPSNETLAANTRKSDRTVRRLLSQLAADGELEILAPGTGRSQKRIIRLSRYVAKPDKALASLNRTRSARKTSRNIQGEQPIRNSQRRVDCHKSAKSTSAFSSFVPYPKTEEEMYRTLEQLGIQIDADHDGDFFAQMDASRWTIRGQPVRNWPAVYGARLQRTAP